MIEIEESLRLTWANEIDYPDLYLPVQALWHKKECGDEHG